MRRQRSSSAMPVRSAAAFARVPPAPATATPTSKAGSSASIRLSSPSASPAAKARWCRFSPATAPRRGLGRRACRRRARFVTGIGAGTTYPDYKPAPFIVASEHAGVDMVTVVTEGIFSYCGVKVKIDTDRHLGAEAAIVRRDGEPVGHVTTSEYGSQMLALGGVRHLTGGGKREGHVTCETLLQLCNKEPVELAIDGGSRVASPPARRRWSTARPKSGCASAAARPRSACSRRRGPERWTRSSSSTITSPACSPNTRPAGSWAWRRPASASRGASRRPGATSGSPSPEAAGAAPASAIRSPSSVRSTGSGRGRG